MKGDKKGAKIAEKIVDFFHDLGTAADSFPVCSCAETGAG